MPVDDRARLNLVRQAVLVTEEANTSMSHLPPVTWNEVATKGDIIALGTTLRTEMQTMETSLRSDMQTMEGSLRTEMQVGFATLRTEVAEASNRRIKWMWSRSPRPGLRSSSPSSA